MFRKSVFIMLFVCLLATVSSAFSPSGNYPWDNQLDWKAGTDANWYEAANWTQAGVTPCPAGGPGQGFEAALSPDQPGPQITGDATAAQLMLNGWDPTSWGAQDVNVTIEPTAGNVNFGATIQINAWADYDSYLGTTSLVNRAILNVYGGTVSTPYQYNNSTNVSGMRIGGGASNFSNAYGLVNMYGGQVIVPNLNIYFGDINLWGGTITVTGDPNFTISSAHFNQVKMDGGTLIVAGDHRVDINNYIANGNIVADRGTLNTPPTYDGSAWTTLTSTGNLQAAYYPQPVNGATEVRYLATNSITLTWNKGFCVGSDGNEVNIIHVVYFGTSATSLTPQASLYDADINNDPCSWAVTGPFAVGATYYWEVNEFNTVSDINTPGFVWKFKTQDGKAYNPRPQTGQNGLKEPLTLSWTAGDWAQSTGGHRVYFGSDLTSVTLAGTSTANVYRGTVSTTSYPMSSLYPTWTIAANKTYYWRIDEVNTLNSPAVYTGTVWTFTQAPYINIDDFEDYNTQADFNANGDANVGWSTGYTVYRKNASCNATSATTAKGKLGFVRDGTGKHMSFTYIDEPSTFAFSEANRPYIGGTVFSSSLLSPAPAALRVDYIGTATNAADPCYDRMYIALEDTAGHIGVSYNQDGNAAKVGAWTTWYTALSDGNLASVNLGAVVGFHIGFGNRLGCMDNESGGDGNVMFDNIRLYAQTCNAAFAPTADLDGDCVVDVCDLAVLANDWLVKANVYTFAITAPQTPVLWYKFDDSGMSTTGLATDSGKTGTYTGTILNYGDSTWNANGKYGGCLYLPSGASSVVTIPTTALVNVITDGNHPTNPGAIDSSNSGGIGLSFSVWVNADLTSNNMQTSWNGLICIRNDGDNLEALELEDPIPFVPTNTYSPGCNFVKKTPTTTVTASTGKLPNGDFGGQWNHWAFVKNTDHMLTYCNGNLVAHMDTNEQPNDPNIGAYGPLWYDVNVSTFRIGARGGNWGMWNGYIDDFRMYDYALSPAEVAYLATNGTGLVLVPLVSKANLYLDGVNPSPSDANQIVNFEDLSVMGIQWHTIQLWP